MNDDILIAGAGIGGLTAALALHYRGIDAAVIDGATELRPLGVGINLLPHAVTELDQLGLAEELAKHAVAPKVIEFYDDHGRLLFREPRGIDELDLDPRDGLRRYETRRRIETADVVAANRAMLRSGAGPDDLADATTRYRQDTKADRRLL